MTIDCDPCKCPDAYYKDSMSWRWGTLKLLCDIDALLGGEGDEAGIIASALLDRIVFSVGDGVNPITAGLKKCVEVTQNCTINKWTVLSDNPTTTAGSIAFDIYRSTIGTYPPVLANSIIGAGTKPALVNAASAQQLTIAGWTSVTLLKGDIIRINVQPTPSLVTSVTLILGVTRT